MTVRSLILIRVPSRVAIAFTYTVNDNDGETSNVATVNLSIEAPPPNQAPIAGDDTAMVTTTGSVHYQRVG